MLLNPSHLSITLYPLSTLETYSPKENKDKNIILNNPTMEAVVCHSVSHNIDFCLNFFTCKYSLRWVIGLVWDLWLLLQYQYWIFICDSFQIFCCLPVSQRSCGPFTAPASSPTATVNKEWATSFMLLLLLARFSTSLQVLFFYHPSLPIFQHCNSMTLGSRERRLEEKGGIDIVTLLSAD